MVARAYVLLDIVNGKSEQVAKALQGKPGVVIAEQIEGPPDLIMVTEASDMHHLAKLTVKAITSVEAMINGLRLLPVQDP
jgi:hypothetical protein